MRRSSATAFWRSTTGPKAPTASGRASVEPYLLLRNRGEWYYVCWCRTARGVRVFRVATTKQARLLDDTFAPRADIELDLYRREGIPTTGSYAPTSALVWYSPLVRRWIAERQPVQAWRTAPVWPRNRMWTKAGSSTICCASASRRACSSRRRRSRPCGHRRAHARRLRTHMSDDVSRALFHAAWIFYALGPQLVICLLLAYAAAKRSSGSLLNWLIVGLPRRHRPAAGRRRDGGAAEEGHGGPCVWPGRATGQNGVAARDGGGTMGGIRIGRLFGIDIAIHPSWFIILGLFAFTLATASSRGLARLEQADVLGGRHRRHPAAVRRGAGARTRSLPRRQVTGHQGQEHHPLPPRRRGQHREGGFEPGARGRAGRGRTAGQHRDRRGLLGPLRPSSRGPRGRRRPATTSGIANLSLAVFNLLPGFPLDGGRVPACPPLVAQRRSSAAPRGRRRVVGQMFGFAFIGLGVVEVLAGDGLGGIWLGFVGWILIQAARASASAGGAAARARRRAHGADHDAPVRVAVAVRDPGPTPPRATSRTTIRAACRCRPERDDQQYDGLICGADLARMPRYEWDNDRVRDVMVPAEKLLHGDPRDARRRGPAAAPQGRVDRLAVVDAEGSPGRVRRSDLDRALRPASGRRSAPAHRAETADGRLPAGRQSARQTAQYLLRAQLTQRVAGDPAGAARGWVLAIDGREGLGRGQDGLGRLDRGDMQPRHSACRCCAAPS